MDSLSCRTYFKAIFIYILVGYLLAALAINVILDPYGEYNIFQHKRYAQSHETMPYKAFEKLLHDDYSLVFGTSHSATLSAKIMGERILNLSTSVYGSPIDVELFLSKLDPKRRAHIQRIYYLLDYHVFGNKTSVYEGKDFSSSFEFFIETFKNINPEKLQRSLGLLIKNITGTNSTSITDNGEFIYENPIPYNHIKYAESVQFTKKPLPLQRLKEIDAWGQRHQIEIIYYKAVFSDYFLANVDFPSLEKHMHSLVDTINGFYSFMILDGVSDDLTKFRDPTHVRFPIVEQQARLLITPENRRIYWIDKHNVEAYLESVRQRVQHFNSK